MTWFAWIIFLVSAMLEVCGDAMIRKGLRGQGVACIFVGFIALGCYGIVVNSVPWDFSKLLGVYVAVFAIVSIFAGRFVFHEEIPTSTWVGLAIIVLGGMVIQFGRE